MPRKAKPTSWTRIEPNIEQWGGRLRVRMWVYGEPRQANYRLHEIDEARQTRDLWNLRKRRGEKVLTAAERAVTVDDVAQDYLRVMAGSWSVRSQDQNRGSWNRMRPAFDMPLNRLQATDVSDWLTAQVDAGRAKNTYTNQLGLLRSILDRAAIQYGTTNVARLVKPPRGRQAGKRRPRRVLPTEDLSKLLGAADDRYRIVWLLALGLGLRSAEIRGLTLDRVGADGMVTIDRQLIRVRGDAVVDEPGAVHLGAKAWLSPLKAENSYAVLNGGRLIDAITDHVERFGPGPAGLIVSNHQGGPLSDSLWSTEVKNTRDAVGVAMVGHDLRRTFGKSVLTQTGDITKVAGALRNDPNTAVRAYLVRELDEHPYGDALLDALTGSDLCQIRAKKHLRVV